MLQFDFCSARLTRHSVHYKTYESKIGFVKAWQYIFSAINKQITYILKHFSPTMPIG